jgi:hypothetical protein
MILLELFGQNEEKDDDGRYDPESDQTIIKKSDTRKTRLTLTQINKLRKISELRAAEKIQDAEKYQKQYGATPEPAMPAM